MSTCRAAHVACVEPKVFGRTADNPDAGERAATHNFSQPEQQRGPREPDNVKFADSIRSIWTACGFAGPDVTNYAESVMTAETRQGVMMLSVFSLLLMLGATALHARLGLSDPHVYTFLTLAALSLHILLSTRATRRLRELYLLAITLLVISGCALVLLAHKTNSFGAPLFSGVALLLMIVPMVPWGLREALGVMAMIYLLFTTSTLTMPTRFSTQTLWALQFLMLSAGAISLSLVVRSVGARKQQIAAHFSLARSHEEMERLSLQDQLTGLFNRRYLALNFNADVDRIHRSGADCEFVLFDIDRFKQFNDQHGHAHGDAILQAVASAYGAVLLPGDVLVRLGGDEFVMLLAGPAAQSRLQRAAADLQHRAVPFGIGGSDRPTISAGLLRLDNGTIPLLDSAYATADLALYEAKRAGGNQIRCAAPQAAAAQTASLAPV